MSYPSVVLADSPILYYRLDDSSGSTAVDSSGNGHNGTYNGGFTLNQPGAIIDGDAAVAMNATANMDTGVDATVNPTGNFSVEAWVKTTQTTIMVVAGKVSSGLTGDDYWIGANLAAGKASFSVQNVDDPASVSVIGAVSINDGAWHHVVGLRDGTTLRLYVDGAADGTAAVSGASAINPSGNLMIGQFGQYTVDFRWNGTLDEAAYYPTALSPARVLAHYVAGLGYRKILVTDAGVDIMILEPASFDPNVANQLIYYHSGAGEDREALLQDALKTSCRNRFLADGYLMAGISAGENWGAQAALDAYSSAFLYILSNYKMRGTMIWAQSMGGLSGLLMFGNRSLFDVRGWLGTYPCCNLADMYAGNTGTYAPEINTAYDIPGGGNYATQTAGHDPVLMTGAKFNNRYMRFYASPSDTVVNKAANSDEMHDLVDSIAQEDVVVVCSGNHGDPSHFQPSDYSAFAQRCLASPATCGGFN